MSGFVASSANCSVCCSHNQALQPVMPLISHGHHGTRQGDPRGPRQPAFSREIAIFPLHCFNMEFPITLGATIAQINQLIGAGHTNKSMGNNMPSIKHSCSVYRRWHFCWGHWQSVYKFKTFVLFQEGFSCSVLKIKKHLVLESISPSRIVFWSPNVSPLSLPPPRCLVLARLEGALIIGRYSLSCSIVPPIVLWWYGIALSQWWRTTWD